MGDTLPERDITQKYELALLVHPQLGVDEANQLCNDVANTIRKAGGTIMSEPRPNRIKLAYPIQKENDAYFAYITFEIDPATIKAIEEGLRLNTLVLRSMTLKKQAPRRTKKRSKASEGESPAPETPTTDDSKPMDNDELEKKLEEILN